MILLEFISIDWSHYLLTAFIISQDKKHQELTMGKLNNDLLADPIESGKNAKDPASVDASQQSELNEELCNPGQNTGGTGGTGVPIGRVQHDLSHPRVK